MVKSAAKGLGGLDIILANATWTRFEDQFGGIESGLANEEWDKVPWVLQAPTLWLISVVLVHQRHASRATYESGSSDF
jgi:hypothetical protein